MPIVSQGTTQEFRVGAADGIFVKCTGSAAITYDGEYSAPTLADTSTGEVRCGYFGAPATIRVNCVSGTCEVNTQPTVIKPLVSKQGGAAQDSSALDVAQAVNGLVGDKPPSVINLPTELVGLTAFGRGSSWGCSVEAADLWNTTGITSTIYVDARRPDDSGNGSSWATAKQSIEAGILAANALGVPTRVLVRAGTYYRQISVGKDSLPKTLTVPMTIEAQYGRVVTGTFDVLTWTKTGGQTNVWQATRSNIQSVWNPSMLDVNGDYTQYQSVASIAACDAAAGSFFTDNTTLYVHTHTSAPANNLTVRGYVNAAGADFKTTNNLLVSGIDFEGGNNSPFTCRDGSVNIVIMNNCTAKYGAVNPLASIAGKDGVQVLGCKIFAAFDSKASRNGKDGFNIHEQGGVKPFGLTVRCSGFNNGFVSTSTSNNGITYHDGCHGIDIGGVWLGSIGTNAGHVDNGTTVWHYGSIAGGSDGDVINGGTWDWGGFGVWNGNGVVVLQFCIDRGARIGVYAPSPAAAYLIGHSGSGQIVGNVQ